MAIIPKDQYPSQIIVSDPGWPHGRPQNDSVPGDGSGTPIEEAWVSDLFGWQQSLLHKAGQSPSGTPDRVDGSQYMYCLELLFAGKSIESRLHDAARGAPVGKSWPMPLGSFAPNDTSAWRRQSGSWEAHSVSTTQLVGSVTVPVGFVLQQVVAKCKAPVHGVDFPPAVKTFLSVRRYNAASGTAGALLASGYDAASQTTYEELHSFTLHPSVDNVFANIYDELEVSIIAESGSNALPGTRIYGVHLYGIVDRGKMC